MYPDNVLKLEIPFVEYPLFHLRATFVLPGLAKKYFNIYGYFIKNKFLLIIHKIYFEFFSNLIQIFVYLVSTIYVPDHGLSLLIF